MVAAHAQPARIAIESGFDAVEIHLGHNYLASAFLSPLLNRRDDRYGGDLANRARLAREIARAVREEVGDTIAILAKLNMDDGVPGGPCLDESIQVAQWLEADGSLDALELTAGSSLLNPMYLFRVRRGGAPPAWCLRRGPPSSYLLRGVGFTTLGTGGGCDTGGCWTGESVQIGSPTADRRRVVR